MADDILLCDLGLARSGKLLNCRLRSQKQGKMMRLGIIRVFQYVCYAADRVSFCKSVIQKWRRSTAGRAYSRSPPALIFVEIFVPVALL